MNLVFLPATEPGDETRGRVPERIATYPSVCIHQVSYPGMVWYNETIRKEAITQIQALALASIVLVGFSKSGLGAWNIARMIPDLVAGTIIFDAPVAGEIRLPYGSDPFYADDESWKHDLPVQSAHAFHAGMPDRHSLVLISGECYHEEMCSLSSALSKNGAQHSFLPQPHLKHHWNSGWIEQGLKELLEPGGS